MFELDIECVPHCDILSRGGVMVNVFALYSNDQVQIPMKSTFFLQNIA